MDIFEKVCWFVGAGVKIFLALVGLYFATILVAKLSASVAWLFSL